MLLLHLSAAHSSSSCTKLTNQGHLSRYSPQQPSRPPPPPPIEYPSNHHQSNSSSNNFHHFSNSGSNHYNSNQRIKASKRDDYIRISDCHTGLPQRPPKPMGFKSRASTSFSSLKPATSSSHLLHSSHQKSRSLTDNHLGSSYLYLDLPSSLHSKSNAPTPPAIVYKTVDFLKTDALNKCKTERTIGRV